MAENKEKVATSEEPEATPESEASEPSTKEDPAQEGAESSSNEPETLSEKAAAEKVTEAVASDDPSEPEPATEAVESTDGPEEPVEQRAGTHESVTDEADEGPDVSDAGDGAVAEPAPDEPAPEFVNRILEEAVEKASQDHAIPTGDEARVDVTDLEEPDRTVSAEDLQRTQESQGFTGEAFGRTVSLDDLEEEERQRQEDPVYSQFREFVNQTSIDVREEDIVQGRVLKVTDDDVVIDIGYKSDGIVNRDEFGEDIHAGDTVEVYLERKEDRDGQLVLSKEKAESVRRWQQIEEIYQNEEIIEGTIVRRIKGGMIVELFDGMEAFLPGSQIDARPVRDFDAYLEKRMEFKIVKLNPSNENIVVSHRELIEEELEEQRQEILSELEVGQVLKGTVKNIVDFGVFIDLGGVDGLLHITDLSWGRVSHPSEIVDLDEEIEVVVLDYEEERQRISLGLKQLKPHPWDNISEKYDEGEVVEGKVVSITNYGAFVELEKGIEGLVHISEMSWTRHIKHPSQMVSLGQLVDVKILNIDEEEKKISLGMKQLEPDPWDGISDRYPAGTVLTGTVRNITNFGVFVEIEPGIDGLVHISDLSWTKKVRHPGDMIDKEQDLDVVILNIDEERRRISLGHKQVKTNPWDQFADAYSEGSDTKGEVVRVEDKGLVVQLPLDVEAFVPGSELKDGPRNFQQHYAEGDELELRVIRFDKGRKDIVLSETAKERDQKHEERQKERRQKERQRRDQQESVRDYQDQQDPEDDSTSGPTTLGELSGLANLKAEMQQAERQEAQQPSAPDEVEAEEVEAEEADAESAPDAEETEETATEFDENAGFPENFPRVSRLEKAGITTLAQLRDVDELEEIEGIGPSYADDIRSALQEFDDTGRVSPEA